MRSQNASTYKNAILISLIYKVKFFLLNSDIKIDKNQNNTSWNQIINNI